MEAVNRKQLAVVKGQVTKAEKIAAGIGIIKNDEDYAKAGDEYLRIKKLEKEFDAEYLSWMRPINELRNKVFAHSRPMKARFKAAKDQLNQAMSAWEEKVESKRLKDADKLESQVDNGEMTLEDATDQAGKLKAVDPIHSERGKLGAQIRHQLVVTEPSKLKREFLMPDMDRIREHYQATGRLPAGVELQKQVVRTARVT